MDINLIRILSTLVLLVLFVVLFFQVFSKKRKRQYEEAANIILDNGDERSTQIQQKKTKVNDHE